MPDPSLDIATHLGSDATVTIGGADAALGTNLFPGPKRAAGNKIPEACIFVTETGGYPPEDTFGTTLPGRPATVQVYIRGPQGTTAYESARTTARAVWKSLHKATISGYVSVRCMQGEPTYLGPDDTEHHVFTVNVIATHGHTAA